VARARADDFLWGDNWLGSYYELAVRVGPRDDDGADERLRAALQAVWSHPDLDGCYLDRWTAPEAQQVVAAERLGLERGSVYGWADIPQGRIVCATHLVREDHAGGHDWLDLCLPTGALGRVEPRLTDPIGGEASRSWREPLDQWFVAIARRLAQATTFELAIIGEEVSGFDDVVTDDAERRVSTLTVEPHGLVWNPPDRW
jgi:hypothetical protein